MRRKRKITKLKYIVKNCAYCGAKFYALRNTARYCSATCRVYAHLERTSAKESKNNYGIQKCLSNRLTSITPESSEMGNHDNSEVIKFLITQIKLTEENGYDWVRVESIQNIAISLFGISDKIPDEFFVGEYNFRKNDNGHYSFIKVS